MKKIIITVTAALMLSIGISSGISSKLNTYQNTPLVSNAPSSTDNSIKQNTETQDVDTPQANSTKEAVSPQNTEVKLAENVASSKSISNTSSTQKKDAAVASVDTKPKQSLSRGGSPTQPPKTTTSNSSKYGELLTWNQVNNLISIGSTIQVTDLSTGKTFNIKRTFGTNHIDGEAPTISDTNVIKSIWGGFSWARRPVIVSINGRKLAASMTAMPHAGVDSAPAVATVGNRSDGYGTGENLDAVKNNGMSGVVDIHFLNSTRHKDNKPDPQHQAAILKAAGK
jgi:uncharacterized protein YxeA